MVPDVLSNIEICKGKGCRVRDILCRKEWSDFVSFAEKQVHNYNNIADSNLTLNLTYSKTNSDNNDDTLSKLSLTYANRVPFALLLDRFPYILLDSLIFYLIKCNKTQSLVLSETDLKEFYYGLYLEIFDLVALILFPLTKQICTSLYEFHTTGLLYYHSVSLLKQYFNTIYASIIDRAEITVLTEVHQEYNIAVFDLFQTYGLIVLKKLGANGNIDSIDYSLRLNGLESSNVNENVEDKSRKIKTNIKTMEKTVNKFRDMVQSSPMFKELAYLYSYLTSQTNLKHLLSIIVTSVYTSCISLHGKYSVIECRNSILTKLFKTASSAYTKYSTDYYYKLNREPLINLGYIPISVFNRRVRSHTSFLRKVKHRMESKGEVYYNFDLFVNCIF